jgi:hypothetical protein
MPLAAALVRSRRPSSRLPPTSGRTYLTSHKTYNPPLLSACSGCSTKGCCAAHTFTPPRLRGVRPRPRERPPRPGARFGRWGRGAGPCHGPARRGRPAQTLGLLVPCILLRNRRSTLRGRHTGGHPCRGRVVNSRPCHAATKSRVYSRVWTPLEKLSSQRGYRNPAVRLLAVGRRVATCHAATKARKLQAAGTGCSGPTAAALYIHYEDGDSRKQGAGRRARAHLVWGI